MENQENVEILVEGDKVFMIGTLLGKRAAIEIKKPPRKKDGSVDIKTLEREIKQQC